MWNILRWASKENYNFNDDDNNNNNNDYDDDDDDNNNNNNNNYNDDNGNFEAVESFDDNRVTKHFYELQSTQQVVRQSHFWR